jgi:hypothetical protein
MVPKPHNEIELVCLRIRNLLSSSLQDGYTSTARSKPSIAVLSRNGQILPLIKRRLKELGVLSVVLGDGGGGGNNSCESDGGNKAEVLKVANKFLKHKVVNVVVSFIKLLVDER